MKPRIVVVGRDRAGRDIVRRLEPRVACSPTRCEENLERFVRRIALRLGLHSAIIFGILQHGRVGDARAEIRASALMSDDPLPTSRPLTPRLPVEIARLLKERLDRLMRHSGLRFGTIEIELRRGEVVRYTPADNRRPKKDGLAPRSGLFAEAPPSKLWGRAIEIP